MFLKKIKNKLLLLITTALLLFPTSVQAYSEYIIAGGENIGIELNSNGIIIVGTYNVGDINPAKKAGLNIGDKITAIDDKEVSDIEEMLNVIESINNYNSVKISYTRGNASYTTNLELTKDENNVYKTGLYVKDAITGVGTLSFIDPNTGLYGALGHEITEKNTGQKLEIKDGKIYNSTVTGITPSNDGSPGEKNARYDSSIVYGNVFENTQSGIFGEYTATIPNKKLYKVAEPSEIKLGTASILTVLEGNEVKEYDINIIRVSDEKQAIKNILFEITDEELLTKAGGIVQGMSGSPIVQGDNIIGAVTHVVVDDCTKGYGIFIVNMLEEAEN